MHRSSHKYFAWRLGKSLISYLVRSNYGLNSWSIPKSKCMWYSKVPQFQYYSAFHNSWCNTIHNVFTLMWVIVAQKSRVFPLFCTFNLNMTSEAAVIIAVLVLLSLFVTVAVAVVSLADFDLYKAFQTSFNLKKAPRFTSLTTKNVDSWLARDRLSYLIYIFSNKQDRVRIWKSFTLIVLPM